MRSFSRRKNFCPASVKACQEAGPVSPKADGRILVDHIVATVNRSNTKGEVPGEFIGKLVHGRVGAGSMKSPMSRYASVYRRF